MIKGILFDMDGTLVDSYEAIAESFNKAREYFGLAALSVDEVRRMVGLGLEVLMARNLGDDRVEDGVRVFREHYATQNSKNGIDNDSTRIFPALQSISIIHYPK